MTSAHWLHLFLDAQAAEAGAARNTILAYGRDLRDFTGWLGRQQIDLASVSRQDIEDYLIFCDAQGLSRSTRARRLVSVRQLFRFAFEERLRSDNPAIRIQGPSAPRRLPDTLTVDEVDSLLEVARDVGRNASAQIRNWCLMELLYATGMRVSELVGLPVASVRGDPAMILVKGKGGKERLVPLSPPSKIALAAWIDARDRMEEVAVKNGGTPSRFLFPSRSRNGFLPRESFFRLVQDMARQAGIADGRVTPHSLRHAFATHLLAGGADLRTIQTMLGHADISTVEIYTHVMDEQLRNLVLNKHPLADPDVS